MDNLGVSNDFKNGKQNNYLKENTVLKIRISGHQKIPIEMHGQLAK